MIRGNTETEIADEQAVFQQGRGTRDQITNLRILMHKVREHQQPNGFVLRKESDKVVSFLRTCSTYERRW